jgi:hypothetical protein
MGREQHQVGRLSVVSLAQAGQGVPGRQARQRAVHPIECSDSRFLRYLRPIR